MRWFLTQVSILFFLLLLFLHFSACRYKTGTPGVTIFDQQMCERDWWLFPYLIDSKFIQPDKQEMQNLLDKEVLQVDRQNQNPSLYQVSDAKGHLFARNLDICQNKPAMLTVRRLELNWFHLVLCTYIYIIR